MFYKKNPFSIKKTIYDILIPFFIFIIPTISVISSKAIVLILIILFLLFFKIIIKNISKFFIIKENCILISVFLILFWSLISISWTINPDSSFFKFLKLTATSLLGCGVVIGMHGISAEASHRIIKAFVYGVYVAIFIAGGHCAWFIATIGFDYVISEINPGLTLIAVFLWPIATALVFQLRWKSLAGLLGSYAGVLALSASAASVLAFAVGALVMGAAILRLKFTAYVCAALMAAVILSAPFIVPRPTTDVSLARHMSVLPLSAQHRLYIWEFVADNALKRPLLGWGFHSSRSIPRGQEGSNGLRGPNLPLHPHNAPLQIWLELGVPGAALFAILMGLVVMRATRAADERNGTIQAATLGSIAAFVVVAFTAYGVWQSWWVATGWLTAGILVAFRKGFLQIRT